MTFRVPFLKGGPKRNKFNARKTTVDGIAFSSALEASVYSILKLKEFQGEITDLRLQHPVRLTNAKVRCKIDFSATDTKTGRLCFYEAKGIVQDRWKIIKLLWKTYGPGILYIYTGSYKRPSLSEVVVPESIRATAELE